MFFYLNTFSDYLEIVIVSKQMWFVNLNNLMVFLKNFEILPYIFEIVQSLKF